jgi:hypothetical protein
MVSKEWLPNTSVNISIDFHPFDHTFFSVSSSRDVRLFGTDRSDMTMLSTPLSQGFIVFPGVSGCSDDLISSHLSFRHKLE